MPSADTMAFSFECSAEDNLRVVAFEGTEEMSRPYRFEIELVSSNASIDMDAMLGQTATLILETEDGGRKFHGVLSEFEQSQGGHRNLFYYRAVLVPRLWLLSMSLQNQIYQEQTVPETIEVELKGSQENGPADLAAAGLTTDDFEFRLTRSYANREYIVQYKETNLDFISRLMEHEGIYYFFEHDDEKEILIIADNQTFDPFSDSSTIPFRTPSGLDSHMAQSIEFLNSRRKRILKTILLKDYNYEAPQVDLRGEAEVHDRGHGIVVEHGDHFKTPEEGTVLANVRAEEIRCQQHTFSGGSDCFGFSPGHTYTLEDHFRDDFNCEYLITKVKHVGRQRSAAVLETSSETHEGKTYENEFTTIPASVPYRPRRRTAKPKMYGIMNARIDAASSGERAEIDAEGRYKVIMPFDLSERGDGKASCYLRMAQPYGGSKHGMHFPLTKDTEVIWACIDGDPDRPIILGTVPNPLTPSVITARDSQKNRIVTTSGIVMEFNDSN